MSRIGKMPIAIPAGVEVKVTGPKVSIKGPLGKLDWALEQGLGAVVEGGQLLVSRTTEERNVRALHVDKSLLIDLNLNPSGNLKQHRIDIANVEAHRPTLESDFVADSGDLQ